MNKNILKKIGKNIRFKRKDKELSQEKLAELCNMSRNGCCSIERGEVNVSILTLCKIAKAFEVELCELLQF